jgi:hypothetical protein
MTYTSPIKIAGLPLVSVVWENKGFREAKPAVGIIAVGQYAYGVVSISQFGAGVFCISQFGVGAVGVFQFGLAGFSISQFAVNLFSGYGQFVFNLAKHLGL